MAMAMAMAMATANWLKSILGFRTDRQNHPNRLWIWLKSIWDSMAEPIHKRGDLIAGRISPKNTSNSLNLMADALVQDMLSIESYTTCFKSSSITKHSLAEYGAAYFG